MSESVTSLRLKVDSTEVKNADKDLNNLSKTAGNTEKSAGTLSRSFASLSTVLGTIGVAALTHEFVKIADEMKLLDSRLKMVSASTAEYVSQKKELLAISKETYSSIADITTLYTKLDPALKSLGATTKDVNNITESFAKGLKLGGAGTAEAASATLQFAQAMGSGVLRGEEFNAMAEASPKLMQYLAEGLGVPSTALRKMAADGELSAGKVSAALLKMTTKIDEDFTQIPMTVGMATTNLKTDLMTSIEQFDKTTGATKALAETIAGLSVDLTKYGTDITTFFISTSKFINEHNEALKTTAALVGGVATAYYGFIAGGAVIKGIQGITVATYGLRTAMIALQASSPILLGISVALGVATAAYLAHDNALEKKNYSTINSIEALTKAHDDLLKKRKEIQNDKFALDKTQKKETAIVDGELKKIENRLNSIGTARSNNVEKAKKESEELIKSAKTLEENAKKLAPPSKPKKAEAEAKKAVKEAEKLREEEVKIQRGYLEGYAELQANAALEEYNIKLGYEEAYREMAAQEAISQYEMELGHIEELAARQAESALAFYEMTRSEQDKINEANLALYEANIGLFNDEQMQTFFGKWQESIDGVKGGYNDVQSIVSSFVEDSLNSKDWTVGLTGTAKSVANLGNAFKDLDKQNKKYETARKGIAKSNLNDEEKSIANKEIENAQFYAQIDAYGALAGAAAGFFEEGSKGAKAMQDISATLGIAQGIQAIIGAWGSAPFPLNMPAVAATTAAVLPMIGQLTSLGGSGGGGGGSVSAEQKFSNTAKYESEQANFIVDRLDRQIELLESIDSGGTAAKTKVSLAGSTFEADIAKLWADMIGTGERAFSILGNITTTGNSLSDVQTAIGWISGMKDVFRPEDWEWLDMTRGDILGFQSELESAVNSFALNLGDVKDTVKDSSQGFKEIYDSLSGTDFYKIRDLQNAYEELGNSIVGSSKDSMLSYISNAVSEMERLGSNYIETTKGILVGGTVNEQVLALKELSIAFGHTFNNSTEEALNFLDSIELVAENMTAINDERQGLHDTYELLVGITTERENELKALDPSNRALQEHIWALEDLADNEIALTEARKASNESIKSFLTGLMDTSTSLDFTASRLGVNVASSVEELASLFIKLSTDTDGLKDSELQLLNANKSYLATQISNTDATKVATNALNNQKTSLNEYLNTITSGISTLEGALSSMVDVIDTLRGSAIGSSYTLGMYQKSMSETLALSGSSDYDKFNESLQKTIGYSSSLSDENNFALSRDMEFAQLVAANQFEGLKVKAFTQIDYLKLIEKNTRNQLDGLEKSITASSASTTSMLDILNAQLNELIGIKFMLKETWESQANGSLIWTSTGGATATQQQGATDYTIDTKTGTSFTGKEAISFVNSALASGDLMSIYTNAVKYGISSTSLDAMMGWASGTSLGWALNQGLPSFAVGTTNVTSDMLANIHKGEIITPAPFADGLRNGSLMMGNQNALIIELRNNNSLLSGIITKQDQQIQILLESRDIQNGSLVVLENIEGII